MEQRENPPATERILAAARALVAAGGAAQVSMGDTAAHAGVSKALVHYHFRDKESLLVTLAGHVGDAVLGRERAAQSALAAASDAHALDAYWNWLEQELRLGDLAILMALSECDSGAVRAAVRRIAHARRDLAAAHVRLVFSRLALAPRIAPALLAQTLVAFADGLAVASRLEPDRDPRPAFDVLWLALLTLSE